MKKLFVLLCMLAGCAIPDQVYTIDGVPVVLEGSKGPTHQHLSVAANLYRKEVREALDLDEEVELVTWRSMREIRWTNDSVLNRAHFDQDTSSLAANWVGICALDVPLYAALTYLYLDEPTEEDLQWAVDLQREMTPLVCTGSNGGVLPW